MSANSIERAQHLPYQESKHHTPHKRTKGIASSHFPSNKFFNRMETQLGQRTMSRRLRNGKHKSIHLRPRGVGESQRTREAEEKILAVPAALFSKLVSLHGFSSGLLCLPSLSRFMTLLLGCSWLPLPPCLPSLSLFISILGCSWPPLLRCVPSLSPFIISSGLLLAAALHPM